MQNLFFIPQKCWSPQTPLGCFSKIWSFSTVCENLRWKRPLRLRNRSPKSRFSRGLNYGPIFRRLWTKVHQIMSADAGEIVICNAVFHYMSCSVLGISLFAIEVEVVRNCAEKARFSTPNFFLGEDPKFWT